MKKLLLLLIAIIICRPVSAQTYRFQYSHDTLGNRVSRVYQGSVSSSGSNTSANVMEFVEERLDATSPEEISPASEEQASSRSSEKDTTGNDPYVKSPAEKEAFLDSMLSDLIRQKPFNVGGGEQSRSDYSVGGIPLEYGVSGSGARTYSVPISTAPDIRYAPTVALVYNSQGGYGYGGYGWDITGLSSITLTSRSNYWDGAISAASSTETDGVFALDGVRFVVNDDPTTSSFYPLITATGRILASPVRGTSGYIKSFNVLYPDGTAAVYGFTEDKGYTSTVYPVERTTNIEGEKIEYLYSFNAADPLDARPTITEIRYGFTTPSNYSARIVFSNTGNIPYFNYYAGRKMSRPPLVSRIRSFIGNTVLYDYGLTYRNNTSLDIPDLLASVTLTNALGEQLPPLNFTYGIDTSSSVQPSLTVTNTKTLSSYFPSDSTTLYRRGKFVRGSHNDGLISYVGYVTYGITGLQKYGFVYPADSLIGYASSIADYTYCSTITAGTGFQTAEAVDTDGDGLDEVIRVNGGSTSSAGTWFYFNYYKRNSIGHLVLDTTTSVRLTGRIYKKSTYSPCRRTYRWGDFLGNGKTQMLAVCYNDNGVGSVQTPYVSLVDPAAGTVIYETISPVGFNPSQDRRLLTADIDGDGRTEICLASYLGLNVYRFDPNGNLILVRSFSDLAQSIIDSEDTYYADINADGYLDILKAPASGNAWVRWTNTGLDFARDTVLLCNRYGGDRFQFFDIDRDGYADLVKTNGTALSVFFHRSGQIGFSPDVTAMIPSPATMLPANIVDYSSMSSFILVDGHTIK